MRPSSIACSLAALTIAGCGGSDTLDDARGGVALTAGKETDAWDRAPAPTALRLSVRAEDGTTRVAVDTGWPPPADMSLGKLDASANVALLAELRDATGAVVMRGGSPFVAASELASSELPLLVGRVGTFARPTTGLGASWPAPTAVLALGRYAVVAAGDAQAELFDFGKLAPAPPRRELPRSASIVASGDGRTLVVIDAGGASYVNLANGTTGAVDLGAIAPADLASGSVVVGEDGAYVIGATRASGPPTAAVLRVASGSVTSIAMTAARTGAAAAWVPGAGLVVAGGTNGGVEVLSANASSFAPSPLALPAVTGAAMAPVGTGAFVLVGGTDPATGAPRGTTRARVACESSCTSTGAAPIDLRGGQGFAAGAANGLVVGASSDGSTVAFLVDAKDPVTATPVPLRAPRRGAAAIALGDGYVAVVGGRDASGADVPDVEVFTPP